ncbi:MAG: hypothetical protein HYX63_23225 [Gammaproteobacteria bacterium]|nr:hypothetical protein [Gammaproteobacteria bacterium]
MNVQYHDPRAAPLKPPEPYVLSADLSQPVTIGLLANGFPDSVAFLEALEQALAPVLPRARFRHYNKGNPSIRVTESLLATIAGECAVVATAYGH